MRVSRALPDPPRDGAGTIWPSTRSWPRLSGADAPVIDRAFDITPDVPAARSGGTGTRARCGRSVRASPRSSCIIGHADAELRAATADRPTWGAEWRQRDVRLLHERPLPAPRRRSCGLTLVTWRQIGALGPTGAGPMTRSMSAVPAVAPRDGSWRSWARPERRPPPRRRPRGQAPAHAHRRTRTPSAVFPPCVRSTRPAQRPSDDLAGLGPHLAAHRRRGVRSPRPRRPAGRSRPTARRARTATCARCDGALAFDWLYDYSGLRRGAARTRWRADLLDGAAKMLALQSLADPAQASYHNHTARELALAVFALTAIEGHPSVEAAGGAPAGAGRVAPSTTSSRPPSS